MQRLLLPPLIPTGGRAVLTLLGRWCYGAAGRELLQSKGRIRTQDGVYFELVEEGTLEERLANKSGEWGMASGRSGREQCAGAASRGCSLPFPLKRSLRLPSCPVLLRSCLCSTASPQPPLGTSPPPEGLSHLV